MPVIVEGGRNSGADMILEDQDRIGEAIAFLHQRSPVKNENTRSIPQVRKKVHYGTI
jgi:hypothetical protein